TIFHRGLERLGFEPALGDSGGSALAGAYQRALLAFLRPGRRSLAPARARARRLWISGEDLRARYLNGARRANRSLRARDEGPGASLRRPRAARSPACATRGGGSSATRRPRARTRWWRSAA